MRDDFLLQLFLELILSRFSLRISIWLSLTVACIFRRLTSSPNFHSDLSSTILGFFHVFHFTIFVPQIFYADSDQARFEIDRQQKANPERKLEIIGNIRLHESHVNLMIGQMEFSDLHATFPQHKKISSQSKLLVVKCNVTIINSLRCLASADSGAHQNINKSRSHNFDFLLDRLFLTHRCLQIILACLLNN